MEEDLNEGSEEDLTQLKHVKISPVRAIGPFVFKEDYARQAAELTSTIIVQDELIDKLYRELRQTRMRLEKVLDSEKRWH